MKKLLLILLLFVNPVFGQDSRPIDTTGDEVAKTAEESADSNDGYAR